MKRWYKERKNSDGAKDSLWQIYESIKSDAAGHRALEERHIRLYSNIDTVKNPYYQSDILSGLTRGVAFNVVSSVVDTLCSKIGSVKPGITFLSNGAGYQKRTSIKDLNDFIYALFRAAKIYETGQEVFRDACIFGTGYLKPYRKGNSVKVERILPAQFHVDNYDGLYGKPSQMFQSKFVNKAALEHFFKKEIDNTDQVDFQNTDVVDLVEVVEGWYLAEDPSKRRHIITTRSQLLLDEPYLCPYDPVQVFRYTKRPLGFHGIGVVEPLVGIQREINKVISMIERAVHVGSNLWAMVPAGSGVTEEAFSNQRRQLGVINYKGQVAPSIQTFNVIAPELFRYLEQLVEKAYELSGISQMSAAGRKDKGITSGVAIRETMDIETQRFLEVETSYHEFYSRVAKHCVWLCGDIAKNENVEVSFEDEDSFRRISWKDIDLVDDEYEVQSYVTNLLPRTPEGKLERIAELMQNGLIDPQEARKLMNYPDVKMDQDLESAARDLIKKTVEAIVDGKDEYESPSKYDDLQFALKYAVQRYNLARLKQDIDPVNMERLLDYISDVEDIMNEMAAEQAPPMPEGDMMASEGEGVMSPEMAGDMPPM